MGFTNWHNGTVARFEPCNPPAREPDYVSESGSEYWEYAGCVVRRANHWGPVASCHWPIGDGAPMDRSGCRTGFASWSAFRRPILISLEPARIRTWNEAIGHWVRATHAPRNRSGQVCPGPVSFCVRRVTPEFVIDQRGTRRSKFTLKDAEFETALGHA